MNLDEESKSSEKDAVQLDYVFVSITLNGITSKIRWDRKIPLLDAILNAGIAAPYSCCRGNCGTCICKIEEGEVRLRRNFVLAEAHLQQGLILTCVATPISNTIRINYDEF